MSSVEEFIAARDLLQSAPNYASAKARFRWPRVEHFNWALDYFDTRADKCTNPALLYVDDKGAELKVSFQSLKERSNKAANFLKRQGLRKGDRVLLMMPSCVELFEIFLGAMKLGCVLIPASTLLTEDDVVDRIARGRTKAIVSSPELISRIDKSTKAASISKVVVGGKEHGWLVYEEADDESSDFKTERDTGPPTSHTFFTQTTTKPRTSYQTGKGRQRLKDTQTTKRKKAGRKEGKKKKERKKERKKKKKKNGLYYIILYSAGLFFF